MSSCQDILLVTATNYWACEPKSVRYDGVHSLRMDFDKGVELMTMPVDASRCQSMPIKTGTSVDSSHSCHLRMQIAQSPKLTKRTNDWCFIIRRPLFEMGKKMNWRGSRASRASRASVSSYTLGGGWSSGVLERKWEVLTEKNVPSATP